MKFKFLSFFLAVCMVNVSAQEKSESSNMVVSHCKISYNVSADNESQTTNLLDILQKYPMIAVDGLGQMTLNGVPDFGLCIDGKSFSIQSSLTADILKSIPARTVDKVEILTNPSSALIAECSGGVINIVTKKQTTNGTDVSLGLNATTLGLLGGDASFNTKYKGLMLNGTYSYGFDNYSKSALTTVVYNGLQTNETKIHPEKLHRANVNAFYQLTKSDGMGVAFNLFSNPAKFPFESVLTHPQFYFYRKDNSTEDITPSYYNISAYYAHLFSPNGTKLSLTYSYDSQPITDDYFCEGVMNSDDQVSNLFLYSNEKNNQKRQDAMLDFVLPFALHHEISIGGRYSWLKKNDSYNYLETRNSEKLLYGESGFKKNFERWYTYLQYQFHSNNFQLTAAVRTEQNQPLSWMIYDDDIINILPSLNLSYAFNKSSIIRADYHSHLASFLWMSNSSLLSLLYDQQNVSSYNDRRSHFFHLGYSKVASKFNFLLDANYIYGGDRTGKVKEYISSPSDTPVFVFAVWDQLCFQKTLISATASYQFSKAMKLQLVATGGYSDEDYMELRSKLTKTGFDGSLVASSWFNFSDGYMLNVNGGYYFPRKSVPLDSYNNYFYRVRASKNFLKDKLTVAIFANDFITRKKDVKQHDINENDIKLKTTGREFGLSMVYHFSLL